MNHLYKAHHITLHVRESNKPAISLYRDNLGFEQTGVEKGYCECRNLVSLSPLWFGTRDLVLSVERSLARAAGDGR